MWLDQVSPQELGLLRDELQTSTFQKRYMARSLERIDGILRYADGAEFYRAQGAAQLLEELLDIVKPNPQ